MGLAPGSQLGRFAVVRQLGAGAMGEVYLAADGEIERHVAIKTVRLAGQEIEGSHGTQLRLRLAREAKAAGRLVHPNIVTLFEAGESDGLYYLVFEYIEGTDLSARMRRPPPLTLPEILRIGRETATALDAAHRVGIIHRDIKPANLLLTTEGTVKVGDFGIAALTGQGTQLTQTGSVVGTPQYLSPEQIRSEAPIDGRSDLFSLGVLLYELLGGRRPFEGGSIAALLYSIATTEPRHLGELRPDLPPRLASAVMRLLEKEPEQRFATAGDLREELAKIEGEPFAVAVEPATITLPATRPSIEPDTLAQGGTTTVQVATEIVPDRRRRMGLATAIIVLIALSGVGTAGVFGFAKWREHAESSGGERSAIERSNDETTAGTAADPPTVETRGEDTMSETAAVSIRTETIEPAPAPARTVGTVVTFRIQPNEAAASAVVKIDGLVRGMAQGSAMTLRPGRHEIVITSPGFAAETLLVDARDSGAPTELEIGMRRSP